MFLATLFYLTMALAVQGAVRSQNVQRLMRPETYQDQTWGVVLVMVYWANAATATTIGYVLAPTNEIDPSNWLTAGGAILTGIGIACHTWAIWLLTRHLIRSNEAEMEKHRTIEGAEEARNTLYTEWETVPELRKLLNAAERLVRRLTRHSALSGASCAGFWLLTGDLMSGQGTTLQTLATIGPGRKHDLLDNAVRQQRTLGTDELRRRRRRRRRRPGQRHQHG